MKKSFLLAIFCLAISSFSFGQFNIIDTTGKVVNDSTVVIYGNATDLMHTSFNVINTGLDSAKVYARRDSVSLPIGDTDNYFCWVLCYGNFTSVSPYSEALSRGGSAGDTSFPAFVGYYNPYGHLGAALIRYTFFAARNHADSSWVIVKYMATPTGIKNIAGVNSSFSAYPNPANNLVSFNYTLASGVQAANLNIFNLLGECVQTLPISSLKSKTSINVQSMPSGIYVCEIAANGCPPVYQKLVVSH
jgi:Secretion system C-terminal sorting domain